MRQVYGRVGLGDDEVRAAGRKGKAVQVRLEKGEVGEPFPVSALAGLLEPPL